MNINELNIVMRDVVATRQAVKIEGYHSSSSGITSDMTVYPLPNGKKDYPALVRMSFEQMTAFMECFEEDDIPDGAPFGKEDVLTAWDKKRTYFEGFFNRDPEEAKNMSSRRPDYIPAQDTRLADHPSDPSIKYLPHTIILNRENEKLTGAVKTGSVAREATSWLEKKTILGYYLANMKLEEGRFKTASAVPIYEVEPTFAAHTYFGGITPDLRNLLKLDE